MRLSALLLAVGCAAPLGASAQYFSQGWKPGQAAPAPSSTPQAFDPSTAPAAAAPAQKAKADYGLSSILTNFVSSGPIASLLDRAGINVTERLSAAQQEIWDERIPLITDENYKEIIVNEVFETEQDEKDRVWFLIISVTTAQPQGVSKYADEQFDAAFNLTQIENDLPNVRWGRIDYINVTTITTKWNVWQAPMLVVLKDRGQTLRFWRATQLRLKPDSLREFLRTEHFERTAPWKSNFGPGGSREFVFDYLAIAMAVMYDYTRRLPRWALYMFTGAFGSLLIGFVHRGDTKKLAEKEKAEAQKQEKANNTTSIAPPPAAPSAVSTSVSTASGTPKKSSAKGKKGKKAT